MLLDISTFLIGRLEFGSAAPSESGGGEVKTNDILAMLSPEGEKVPLQKVRSCLYVVTCCT